MQANGSNWQQFPCGNSEQPPPRVNTWQGKQGPVVCLCSSYRMRHSGSHTGDPADQEGHFKVVINDVIYVGMAVKTIESVRGVGASAHNAGRVRYPALIEPSTQAKVILRFLDGGEFYFLHADCADTG